MVRAPLAGPASPGWAFRSAFRVALPALAGGLLLAVLAIYFQRGFIPGDAFTYIAAGERLNAGHLLYALSPGDRPVEMNPPLWTVPLLSPPFMGVLARPFALLGDAGAYAWWACCLAAIGGTVVALGRRRPAHVSLAVMALVFPLAYEIGVGNVNGLLLAAAVGAWLLVRSGNPGRVTAAGPLAIVMVAAKLTPLPVAAWVAGAGGRRGLTGLVLGGVIVGAVSVVGAGFAAHLEYLSIMRSTTDTGLSPASLGGLARAAGLPSPVPALLPTALLVTGSVASFVLAARGRPAAGFALAVVAWAFGTPVVNINTPSILLAVLAPLAWPWSGAAREPGELPVR